MGVEADGSLNEVKQEEQVEEDEQDPQQQLLAQVCHQPGEESGE